MILYTVVPCYNEEDALPETVRILSDKYFTLMRKGMISEESRILLVDDGSSDDTWNMIREYHDKKPIFCGLKLSRNRGHQNALYAGLMAAAPHCDAAVSIDADLQDDVDAIDQMIVKFDDGYDIVYGVRNKRDSDRFMKRFTAEGYYKIMQLCGAQIIFNHADFRLMSRRAIEALSEFEEVNLFLRGMVPMIGYKSGVVFYERRERRAGESKYTIKKMLDLAWNGITSFSTRPIEMIFGAGVLMAALSVLAMLIMLILSIAGVLNGSAGWIIASIFLCGGTNLAAVGVVGEYVGKAYLETKHRPKYFIEEELIA